MNVNSEMTTLDIVSDVVCPWCYIGKQRLSGALELLGPELPMRVRWRPYELNPTMPRDGMDRKAYYVRKFGSEEYVEQLIANVAANARNDGLELNYANITRVPNTRMAHRLIWLAERFDAQDAIVDGLFAAYFVDGRDIGDSAVLIDIAVAAGLERATVENFLAGDEAYDIIETEEREAQSSGIQGVPAFLLNGRFLFSGAQSPETISLAITQALARNAPQSA
ncbi:MAG TPA: DsbA family oxidoreductase [Gammaproteobacteria bacterium]|jgi:predicted DsbA family dithiol-disulfide isomerase|nr:DsbA family oxidoreductase [Gammaproteobacteria bacterium]